MSHDDGTFHGDVYGLNYPGRYPWADPDVIVWAIDLKGGGVTAAWKDAEQSADEPPAPDSRR